MEEGGEREMFERLFAEPEPSADGRGVPARHLLHAADETFVGEGQLVASLEFGSIASIVAP